MVKEVDGVNHANAAKQKVGKEPTTKKKDILNIFNFFDSNNDKKLSGAEIAKFINLVQDESATPINADDINESVFSKKDIRKMLKEADTDGQCSLSDTEKATFLKNFLGKAEKPVEVKEDNPAVAAEAEKPVAAAEAEKPAEVEEEKPADPPKETKYTNVKADENLSRLAKRLGVEPDSKEFQELLELNKDQIKNFRTPSGKIVQGFLVGAKIKLPDGIDASKLEPVDPKAEEAKYVEIKKERDAKAAADAKAKAEKSAGADKPAEAKEAEKPAEAKEAEKPAEAKEAEKPAEAPKAGEESTSDAKYDDKGNLIEEKMRDENNEVTNVITYERDADGKITKSTDTGVDGKVRSTTEYEYKDDGTEIVRTKNANGQVTKSIKKDANGNVTKTQEFTYNEDGSFKYVDKYYENGEVTETEEGSCNKDRGYINRIKKDANGNVTQTQEFTYNEDGSYKIVKKDKDNRTTQITKKDANGNVTCNHERTYNEDGSFKYVEKYYENGEVTETEEAYYDKNGDSMSTLKWLWNKIF